MSISKFAFFVINFTGLLLTNLATVLVILFFIENQLYFFGLALAPILVFSLIMADLLSPFIISIPEYREEFGEGK